MTCLRRRRCRPCLAAAALCLATLFPAVRAHEAGTSQFRLDIGERALESRFRLDLLTLLRLVPGLDADRDERVSIAEVEAARETVTAYLNEHVSLDIDGAEAGGWGEALPIFWPDEEGRPVDRANYHQLLVHFPYRKAVAGRPREARVTFDVFVEFGGAHRVLGDIGLDAENRETMVFSHLEPDYLFDVAYALKSTR
ncbi:MAG: hypothetical protein KDM91_19015 [Verrucomicrobiae bacterium]|nr:hypothetical protein [Verrucomicrobiae bacterium]MCP5539911.1 hypothetical protein [Akkermansiaceae bacterium]